MNWIKKILKDNWGLKLIRDNTWVKKAAEYRTICFGKLAILVTLSWAFNWIGNYLKASEGKCKSDWIKNGPNEATFVTCMHTKHNGLK